MGTADRHASAAWRAGCASAPGADKTPGTVQPSASRQLQHTRYGQELPLLGAQSQRWLGLGICYRATDLPLYDSFLCGAPHEYDLWPLPLWPRAAQIAGVQRPSSLGLRPVSMQTSRLPGGSKFQLSTLHKISRWFDCLPTLSQLQPFAEQIPSAQQCNTRLN